jgi:hypothetical protein
MRGQDPSIEMRQRFPRILREGKGYMIHVRWRQRAAGRRGVGGVYVVSVIAMPADAVVLGPIRPLGDVDDLLHLRKLIAIRLGNENETETNERV